MKGPDRPKKYQESDNEWTNMLKGDPKFRELVLDLLQIKILDKKFGEDFIENYEKLRVRRGFENEDGEMKTKTPNDEELGLGMFLSAAKESEDPLIKEVHDFQEKVDNIEDIESLLIFAEKEGFGFTEEEKRAAVKTASNIREP